MFGRLRWREVAAQGPKRSATEVLEFLHPELCATLASLHGAPRSVAEATVQLLPLAPEPPWKHSTRRWRSPASPSTMRVTGPWR